MRQRIDPEFEYDRGPVLWSGATTLVLGMLVLFVLHRPGWLLPAGLVAGAVAGARSGFYSQSANNGLVGVLCGLPILIPVVFLYRYVLFPAADDAADRAFVTAVLTLVDLLVYGPLVLVFGYLGATFVDVARRRSNGRIGY